MDEYFSDGEAVTLESGFVLDGYTIAYRTYGTLNQERSNVIWVCHALTANADVFDWWQGLFGQDALFNPTVHFVVCANILGSCYGTTGPLDDNPHTGRPYYHHFPEITVRDMVRLHIALADHLAIGEVGLLIGGSLGGQQALEWSIIQKGRIGRLVLIATNAWHSPWGIAFNEAQRMAIEADSTWYENEDNAGASGLKAARAIALLSYRHYITFQVRQAEPTTSKLDMYLASTYQRYQGLKLKKRFNAFSYYRLSKAMDTHQIGRGRDEPAAVLARLELPVLVIGLSSDLLFPISEQEFLARHVKGARLAIIDSLYGHDGFLIETETLGRIILQFLEDHPLEKSRR